MQRLKQENGFVSATLVGGKYMIWLIRRHQQNKNPIEIAATKTQMRKLQKQSK